MANRLANETSPYLLQHKDNPVDWYPWGEEAFAAARRLDRPVLLSVGYSACHWCHVMEHESFEDEHIASLMNQQYVNIKVDREERPDVDDIYMQAVQALTGRGGWPMTVFLLPNGAPFYAGTYFPPEDRGGIPAFPRVLNAVAEAYRERRGELDRAGEQLVGHIAETTRVQPGGQLLTPALLDQAFEAAQAEHDPEFGGFGPAPKFPQAMALDFVLRYHYRSKRPAALEIVERTLGAMAFGGIYDQVGGGFHRYSTDSVWLVPHFEKMLYDNGLLARVYLDAFKVTGDPLYRRIAQETLDYVLREMADPAGGFYSSQDADSEGEEGKFYVWTPAEFQAVLGDDAPLITQYFRLSAEGHFADNHLLHVELSPEDFAAENGLDAAEFAAKLAEARAKLFEAREQRVHPGRDDKVITAWNALILRALAEAALTLDSQPYREAAKRNADFLLATMRPEGRLLRTWKPAGKVKGKGSARLLAYLEDYALLVHALLAMHAATLEPRYLQEAIGLADQMLDLFWDEDTQGFYDTGRDHETLVTRPRHLFDSATPSGTSAAADALLRLALLTGNEVYERRAVACLRALVPFLDRAATSFGNLLCALDFYLSKPQELAIVTPPRPARASGRMKDAAAPLLDVVRGRYLPHLLLTGGVDGSDAVTPLLQDRPAIDGKPTAYLCERFVCQAPTTDPEELRRQIEATL